MTTTTIAAWLLTYLLHSTIILVAALAVSRIMDGRDLAAQEALLRTALVGGVLTATLQLGLGISPIAGVFALDSAVLRPAADTISAPIATGAEAAVLAGPGAGPSRAVISATALIVFWGIASISALIAVFRSILDLRRLLLTRCFQPAGRLVEVLAAAMGLHRKVRVSTSKAIAVPFATGIRQPEICCPERVNELAREHRAGLFAHELAHLARRDPAWQLFYRLSEALFALQPLNRLVRRRLEDLAEHLTDERAAACTGDRLGLARCLVVVAHWGHSSHLGLPATTLAAGPRLDRRIRRLISGTTNLRSTGRWALPICIALLICSVSILPAVGPSPAYAELSQPSVADSSTWSTTGDRPADAPPPPADPSAPPAPPTSLPSAPEPAPAQAPPAPATAPAPGVEPVPPTAPAPASPASPPEPAEVRRQREAARSHASEKAMERALMEARERMCAAEAKRETLRLHIREQRTEAQRLAREEMLVERDRSRALAQEARALAMESIAKGERLTAEQGEDLQRQALELRAQAELQNRKTADEMREAARALADQARALAEQAEADRLEREKEER
jgi:beta-lactamase regulating signal transducer with metallopeptidase domain